MPKNHLPKPPHYPPGVCWTPGHAVLDPQKKSWINQHLSGSTILDVGCATGIYVNYISQKNLSVTGIDQDAHLIRLAQSTYPKLQFRIAAAESLPYESKSIDTLIAFDLLEHISETSLQEFYRVTKSKMLLCVPHTTPQALSRHFILYGHHIDTTHRRTYTPNSLNQVLSKYHFRVDAISPSHYLNSASLMPEFFIGSHLSKKIWSKLTFTLFKPAKFPTNILVAATPV